MQQRPTTKAVRDRRRRLAFVRAYVAGPPGVAGNATRAAMAAGISSHSALVAGVRGSLMLKRPDVLRDIARHLDRMDATNDRVTLELRRLAFADLRDVGEWGPRGFVPHESADLDDHAAATVKGVRVREVETESGFRREVEILQHDKAGPLGLLAKINKLLVDRRELTGRDGGPIEVVDLSRLSVEELRAYRAIRARLDGVTPLPEDLAALRALAAPRDGERTIDVRAEPAGEVRDGADARGSGGGTSGGAEPETGGGERGGRPSGTRRRGVARLAQRRRESDTRGDGSPSSVVSRGVRRIKKGKGVSS